MAGTRLVFDTESFIKKSKSKYGDKFDYSQAVYTKAKEKIKIRCVQHDHWFEVIPDVHNRDLSAGGCLLCAKENRNKDRKLSIEDFITRSNEIHDFKYDYSLVEEFKNAHTMVKIVCPIHGEFNQTVNTHLHSKSGCPRCAHDLNGDVKRGNTESFIERMTTIHGDLYDYSKVDYINCNTKVTIVCKEHGDFKMSPANHSKRICPKCSAKGNGFKLLEAGTFYILRLTEDVCKFGITNKFTQRIHRLRKYSSFDIDVMYKFDFELGQTARYIELDVKEDKSIQKKVLSKADMKDGYTETFYLKDISKVLEIVTKYTPA